jgi:uncharacterized protein YfaP (DUF2135 family)
MSADSEQHRYLLSLQRRLHAGQRLSLWLALAAAAALLVSVSIWAIAYAASVFRYARVDASIRLERSPHDPNRLLLLYRPLSGGEVRFRRSDAGRETELLDQVSADATDVEQKFEWRCSGVKTGDVLKVTFREGWSTVTRELTVPESPPVPPLGSAVLSGEIVNATNNQPVAGAVVKIIGTRLSARSGKDGRFWLPAAPAGPAGIEISAANFSTEQIDKELVAGAATPLRVVLSPGMEAGQIRLVLTWGKAPADLDAHLEGPLPEGKRFHVYFKEKGDLRSKEFVNLDVDARNGVGPETITLLGVLPGVYHYSVQDYTNRDKLDSYALARAQAEVKVYQGGQAYRFLTNGESQGNIWHVCDIEVSAKGARVKRIDKYESKQAAGARQELVFGADLTAQPKENVGYGTPEKQEITEPPPPKPAPRTLRLAVSPDRPQWDDMGKLLESLGEGYKYDPLPVAQLDDYDKIARYDVIFLTCFGGAAMLANDRVAEALREYVGKGGTLYASDFQFQPVAYAFPDFVDKSTMGQSPPMTVTAEVVDEGLRELLGPRVPLRFDLGGWYHAAFAGKDVTNYLVAHAKGKRVPLLVKFRYKEGTVIFTSFHNEKQNSQTETKLLRYLVFAAVTAKTDAEVDRSLAKDGFKPTKRDLTTASVGQQSPTQTYACEKSGPLQFVLGFPDLGARLKLTVTGPSGERFEKEGISTFSIDVPNAAVGDWKYTVTALEVPNRNFPVTVTVAEK